MIKIKRVINTNALPHLESEETAPSSGFLEKPFSYCTRNFNQNCIQHYKKVSDNKGYHVCPYGFTSLNTDINGKKVIVTSIEVQEHRDRKKALKYKSKHDRKKIFNKYELSELIKWANNTDSVLTAKNNILRDFDTNTTTVETKKEILDDTLHELRKLNNMLKKQAFEVKKELEKTNPNKHDLAQRAKNIQATSQAISVRLNAHDFTLNPDIVETNPPKKIGLYKKFEKARHCIELITRELDTSIVFKGQSRALNECYDIVEILPFILFDNALKFNLKNEDIICEFIEENSSLVEIKVTNSAILPKKSELSNLKEKHFRSKNTEIAGTGKGLYIANLICEYHDYELIIETENESIDGNDTIGVFKVTVKIR